MFIYLQYMIHFFSHPISLIERNFLQTVDMLQVELAGPIPEGSGHILARGLWRPTFWSIFIEIFGVDSIVCPFLGCICPTQGFLLQPSQNPLMSCFFFNLGLNLFVSKKMFKLLLAPVKNRKVRSFRRSPNLKGPIRVVIVSIDPKWHLSLLMKNLGSHVQLINMA